MLKKKTYLHYLPPILKFLIIGGQGRYNVHVAVVVLFMFVHGWKCQRLWSSLLMDYIITLYSVINMASLYQHTVAYSHSAHIEQHKYSFGFMFLLCYISNALFLLSAIFQYSPSNNGNELKAAKLWIMHLKLLKRLVKLRGAADLGDNPLWVYCY